MKKTISITISGIIFNIEEDGYECLKSYLESLRRYFAQYQDSLEIMSDIENRIAERFNKITGTDRQAITLTDVEELIAVMGSPADFAAEEGEPVPNHESYSANNGGPTNSAGQTANGYSQTYTDTTGTESGKSNRLYRDSKRKLISGVAAGLAAYLNTDPLIVRLVFLVLTFGWLGLHPIAGFGGFTVLLYIALWASMPANAHIPENPKTRRFFRHPEHKVLGGVAGGIAGYFGIDVAIVRLLFVLGIFMFGTGLMLYLVLWAITPVAGTLTERMQMEGQAITIANIEEKVKSTLNEKNVTEESTVAKILLLPFRVLNALFSAIGPLARFVLEAIRVVAGAALTFAGIVATVALVCAAGVLLGIISDNHMVMGNVPVSAFTGDLSMPMVLCGLGVSVIPVLFLLISGISLIGKRNLFTLWLTLPLFSIWVLCCIGFAATGLPYANNFRIRGENKITRTYRFNAANLHLDVHPSDFDSSLGYFENAELTILPSPDDSLRLEIITSANGPTRREGEIMARSIRYGLQRKDSALIFDSHFSLSPGTPYRGQELKMLLHMPSDRVFTLSREMEDILRNTIYNAGYSSDDLGSNRWAFVNGKLRCLTCTHEPDSEEENNENDIDINIDASGNDREAVEENIKIGDLDMSVKVTPSGDSDIVDIKMPGGIDFHVKAKSEDSENNNGVKPNRKKPASQAPQVQKTPQTPAQPAPGTQSKPKHTTPKAHKAPLAPKTPTVKSDSGTQTSLPRHNPAGKGKQIRFLNVVLD